jgi:hypothetical protein
MKSRALKFIVLLCVFVSLTVFALTVSSRIIAIETTITTLSTENEELRGRLLKIMDGTCEGYDCHGMGVER